MNPTIRYSRLFSEFMHNPFVAMDEKQFLASKAVVMENMRAGIALEFEPKTLTCIIPVASHEDKDGNVSWGAAADGIECTCKADVNAELSGDGMTADNTFVNVVCIEGTMTRGGDACTYGSKDHKEMMMDAADDPRCRGHVLHINSGGGAVGTLMDYRDAINYCLERGQNVAAVISEYAASAANFTSNMTNRVFAERNDTEMGSLGMFAIFSTIADGTVDPMTNEVLHIRYAKQSPDKNYEMREAADGNMKPIDDMLAQELDEILADTRKDRPCVKADQLTGKMYKARDVIGSLVDEIGDMDAAINWLVSDWEARQGAALPLKLKADEEEPQQEPEPKNDPEPAAPTNEPEPKNPAEPSTDPEPDPNKANTNPQTTNPMFENIAAALNLESIEHTADGVMLNTPLAEALEQHLANHAAEIEQNNQAHAAAVEQLNQAHTDAIAALNAEIAALKDAAAKHDETVAALTAATEKVAELEAAATEAEAAHASAIETINTEHQTAIEQLNAEHATAIEQLNTEHAAAVATLSEANTAANNSLATANEQLLAANQRVNDLTAEVEALNNAQGHQPQTGQQPVSNGKQGAAVTIGSTCAYNPGMSAAEYAEYRRKNGIKY